MDKETLLAGGFVPTTHPGQTGEFLTKRTLVEDLPYAREHMVDGSYIRASFEAITEVTPQGDVNFYIPDSEYVEGPYALASDEGLALVNDALAEL